MKSSSLLNLWYLYALLCVTLLYCSCKKDSGTTEETTVATSTVTTSGATREQLTLDSIFLYAKETYLWYDALPAYDVFKPRAYASSGSGLGIFEKELFDITQYKVNSLTGLPYEYYADYPDYSKFSYIEDSSSSGSVSVVPSAKATVSLEGVGNDFGMGLSAVAADDIRIRYVSPGSPADTRGLVRGDRLVLVNGRTTSAGSTTEVNYINDAFDASAMTLKVEKADGTTQTFSLTKTTYNSSPVYKKAVIEKSNKKVGYLALAHFSSLSNSETVLKSAFTEFATAGVSSLVIDLRYNGGGYVSTAELLANLIAPSSLKNKVMYTEYFNDIMQKGKASILANLPYLDANNKMVSYTSGVNGKYATYADLDYSVNGNTYTFSKEGTLDNIKTVCFIVTGNTASASELVINALKPYLDVKLVGTTTYGKPVGFFGINIDQYTVYMSNFQSKNANSEGDYFSGFEPDISSTDDVTRDFGNTDEVSLSKALSYIISGNTLTANTRMTLKGGNVVSAAEVQPETLNKEGDFKGMIENRYKLKK